ncbi:bifunctional adenosylcobinamide kinase/adenosylcobinamide-phosphate guanylyltransferase [Spongiactinospora sp. TRM90649]|uniref:bifunctional adenosylcobinamide kinase/adenosylcobinamide-phosphate guanylyltransferase n=1 Tax=Spongiactinospora sp. TRM90649 TaxID=3031114 RepID=UPI0023F85D76|nr:bifunctional adenosylcobinamide kinase/adenosylcobinamide-phosphate guanylyltransferase [Spongiactinospora sp. TRM90649]MDF5758519.1 bifunctional adenosylcobinamide kinase/adenosylcobinamide-phosphate guanylyltransferase [Spongiactinospora sp. TRM90649]
MRVEFEGTAGPGGFPEAGCPCAACGRVSAGHRRPLEFVVDGVLRLTSPAPHAVAAPHVPPGHTLTRTTLGAEIVSPGGGRLLVPGDVSAGSPGAPFDVVVMDLLEDPSRLGALRRAGAAGPETTVVAAWIDHRVASEAELARRARLWGAHAVPDGAVLDTGRSLPPLPRPARRTLLLGGARSGKSAEAELRLAAEPHVTYVATGDSGGDADWLARIDAHRRRRPPHWDTAETTDLPALLDAATAGTALLIDGIGTWLAAVLGECGAWDDAPGADDGVRVRCAELVSSWRRTPARLVAVSDETGLGVVPATRSGRLFRDALGALNQALTRESEETCLVVAGRPVPLPV